MASNIRGARSEHFDGQTITMAGVTLQEELQEAAGDQGYRLLLWTWALLHCTLVAACCNFIGTNDVFPLAILGALLLASAALFVLLVVEQLRQFKSCCTGLAR